MTLPTNIVILVAAIFAFQVEADGGEKIKKLLEMPDIQKCITSSGFHPEVPHPDEKSPEMLCFFKCVMEERGMLDDSGAVNPDALDKAPFPIPDDKKEEIKKCAGEVGKIETCEDMAKLYACVPH